MDFERLRGALSSAAPSKEALRALGISGDEADGFVASFQLVPRESARPAQQAGTIESFFQLYDPSRLEIGMVRFAPSPKTIGSGSLIGAVEGDDLVVDKATGKVYVSDIAAPGQALWNCADSLEHFLLALIPAARYLGQCLVSEAARDDRALQEAALKECVAAAGGERYRDFYLMLLGVD